ncbi:MAG: cupredoxin family copper-binding protein [Chloroflexi bacterium]|nr:cupredoxin family copper-binding protein [Chloroflexota bacterium]
MQQTGLPKGFPLMMLAALMVAAMVCFMGVAVFWMARGAWDAGGWGMGSGHMGRMMGGGTNSSNAPLTAGTQAESVSIRDFAYAPGNLQVPVGATVTWTNYDDAPHTATAKDGSWDTGMLNKNEKTTITFELPGAYEYYCKVHPDMIARLTVQ